MSAYSTAQRHEPGERIDRGQRPVPTEYANIPMVRRRPTSVGLGATLPWESISALRISAELFYRVRRKLFLADFEVEATLPARVTPVIATSRRYSTVLRKAESSLTSIFSVVLMFHYNFYPLQAFGSRFLEAG